MTLERPTRSRTEKITAAEARGWKGATRRHRRATLAGLWAESLSRSSTNVMLGSLTRELHEEQRSDPRARELAGAVDASTRVKGDE